jgi:hypothetical protein
MSERWTCVMTKGLTFAHEPEGNELGVAQVDDLCGKHSALVTKVNDGRHSLLFRYAGSIAEENSSREVVVRKSK